MAKLRKGKLAVAIASLALAGTMLFSLACTAGEQGATGPQGPQGPQGVQGEQGLPGEDGKTPYIGENGNWWVGDTDLGVNAGTVPDPLVALNETKAPVTHDVSGYLYMDGKFVPDYENINENYKHSRELNIQAAKEGFVLLKNDNNALPLSSGNSITMLGFRSYNPQTGGGGSGSGVVGAYGVPYTDIVTGIKSGGFEINPRVKKIYEQNGAMESKTELSPSILAAAESSFERYNDAALVTIGRSGSEGSDIKMSNVDGHSDKTEHFLELDDNEEALIRYAKQHFSKVIVLLNSANTMELGELNAPKTEDNLGVDAILQVGHMGNDGAAALGDVLNGTVSPSGKTVDTWTRDFTKDPSYANFSSMTQNGEGWNNNLYNPDGTVNSSYHTVEYREDIYVGYKYYETLYDDMAVEDKAEADKWYADAVVYPFGYGMSYTKFEWELVGAGQGEITAANETVTLKVRVTNTGDVAGKDVVQMYVNPPYTYGGIEKASANLMDFAKTDLLQPGQSQVLTLQCVAQDFASFDWNDLNGNGFKGYELEAGDYIVSVNRSAHEEAFSVTRTVEKDIKCTTDYTTGDEITAVLSQDSGTWAEYNSTNASLRGNMLSRMDLTAVPEAASIADRTMTQAVVDAIEDLDMMASCKDEETDPWYVEEKPANWTQGAGEKDENGRYKTLLRDMAGVSYQEYEIKDGQVIVGQDAESQKWEEFLNQLTWEEMTAAVQYGWYGRHGIDTIGMEFQADTDGPNQPGGPNLWIVDRAPGTLGGGTCWTGIVIQASTWNDELLEEIGKAIGNEALFINLNGWYGPGMNIHRSPFGGRNFEYYSEDGVLSGKMAAAVVKGASSKGVVCYLKHMFLNDQETDRDTLFTYVSEQAIREIYLKPFEMAIKEGHSMGIMAAKNRVGNVSAEANAAVTNSIIRGEWNYKGIVVTDAYSGMACKTVDAMVRSGTDIPLSGVGKRNNADGTYFLEQNRWDDETDMVYVGAQRYAPAYGDVAQQPDTNLNVASPTLWASVRRSVMHLLYAAANSSGNRNGWVNGETEEFTATANSAFEITLAEGYTLSNVKLAPESELPTGLFISEDGVVSGTLAAGTYTFTVECLVDGWIGLTNEINQTNAEHIKEGAVREVSTIVVKIVVS